MPKRNENASNVKHSSVTSTSAHETGFLSTISPETQSLIDCLSSLNQHWEQTYNALRKTYPERITNELLDSGYNSAFEELKKSVQQFLLFSIENNMAEINSTKI